MLISKILGHSINFLSNLITNTKAAGTSATNHIFMYMYNIMMPMISKLHFITYIQLKTSTFLAIWRNRHVHAADSISLRQISNLMKNPIKFFYQFFANIVGSLFCNQ